MVAWITIILKRNTIFTKTNSNKKHGKREQREGCKVESPSIDFRQARQKLTVREQ